jgi:hypothetical protein
MRHTRETSHHHAEGYPISEKNTRGMGRFRVICFSCNVMYDSERYPPLGRHAWSSGVIEVYG